MPYTVSTYEDHGGDYRIQATCHEANTLEEARRQVFVRSTAVPGYTSVLGFPTDAAIARAITAEGGTIGPFPDGTVVLVEHTPKVRLAAFHTPTTPNEEHAS